MLILFWWNTSALDIVAYNWDNLNAKITKVWQKQSEAISSKSKNCFDIINSDKELTKDLAISYTSCLKKATNSISLSKDAACKLKDWRSFDPLQFNRNDPYTNDRNGEIFESYNYYGFIKNSNKLYYVINSHQVETDGPGWGYIYQYDCKSKKSSLISEAPAANSYISIVDKDIYFVEWWQGQRWWINEWKIIKINLKTKDTATYIIFNSENDFVMSWSKSSFSWSDKLKSKIEEYFNKGQNNYYDKWNRKYLYDKNGNFTKNINAKYINLILQKYNNWVADIIVELSWYQIKSKIDFNKMTIK